MYVEINTERKKEKWKIGIIITLHAFLKVKFWIPLEKLIKKTCLRIEFRHQEGFQMLIWRYFGEIWIVYNFGGNVAQPDWFFFSRMLWLTTSNAFFKSRKTPMQNFLLLSSWVMWFVRCRRWWTVDLLCWKPYWFGCSKWLISRWLTSLIEMIFSRILERELSNDIQ